MDLLERLLGHDHWTTRQMLEACGTLDEANFTRRFDIGTGSLHDTFAHMIGTAEFWTDQIGERPTREYTDPSGVAFSAEALLERLDASAGALHDVGRGLVDDDRLDEVMEVEDQGHVFRFTRGTALLHVITHSMHHRAQILHMLRLLGVDHDIEGDAITWELCAGIVPQDG